MTCDDMSELMGDDSSSLIIELDPAILVFPLGSELSGMLSGMLPNGFPKCLDSIRSVSKLVDYPDDDQELTRTNTYNFFGDESIVSVKAQLRWQLAVQGISNQNEQNFIFYMFRQNRNGLPGEALAGFVHSIFLNLEQAVFGDILFDPFHWDKKYQRTKFKKYDKETQRASFHFEKGSEFKKYEATIILNLKDFTVSFSELKGTWKGSKTGKSFYFSQNPNSPVSLDDLRKRAREKKELTPYYNETTKQYLIKPSYYHIEHLQKELTEKKEILRARDCPEAANALGKIEIAGRNLYQKQKDRPQIFTGLTPLESNPEEQLRKAVDENLGLLMQHRGGAVIGEIMLAALFLFIPHLFKHIVHRLGLAKRHTFFMKDTRSATLAKRVKPLLFGQKNKYNSNCLLDTSYPACATKRPH